MSVRLRLIAWSEEDAAARADQLERAGYLVEVDAADGAGQLKLLRADPPDLVVIDLDRAPSHGRETARAIRTTKTLRWLPLVFAGGELEKVALIKRLLPDAEFASWRGIRGALKRALASPPLDPVVPTEHMAGYSGTPLPKKLGIKEGATVAFVDAPDGFAIPDLPEGVTVKSGARGKVDVALWFVTKAAVLERKIDSLVRAAGERRLWICWPKKASGVPTEVAEGDVRAAGLAAGVVDYKIAAIDQTWSGLLFTTRKR